MQSGRTAIPSEYLEVGRVRSDVGTGGVFVHLRHGKGLSLYIWPRFVTLVAVQGALAFFECSSAQRRRLFVVLLTHFVARESRIRHSCIHDGAHHGAR